MRVRFSKNATPQVHFFTVYRVLKLPQTAQSWKTAIPQVKKNNFQKTAPKTAQYRITANPYAPLFIG